MDFLFFILYFLIDKFTTLFSFFLFSFVIVSTFHFAFVSIHRILSHFVWGTVNRNTKGYFLFSTLWMSARAKIKEKAKKKKEKAKQKDTSQ